MTRKTSIDVYRQIEREGLLGQLQMAVYDSLFERGPLTQMELSRVLDSNDSRNISPRFAELKRMGCVASSGEKICSVTGRKVTLWDVTDRIPNKKALVSREKTKAKIARLEARNKRLRFFLISFIDNIRSQINSGKQIGESGLLLLRNAEQYLSEDE